MIRIATSTFAALAGAAVLAAPSAPALAAGGRHMRHMSTARVVPHRLVHHRRHLRWTVHEPLHVIFVNDAHELTRSARSATYAHRRIGAEPATR